MKHIKSRDDARRALAGGAGAKLLVSVLGLIDNFETGFAEFGGWEPEEHGWVVLLETPADLVDAEGLHLSGPLAEAPWEGVTHRPDLGCFEVVIILNNDFGLSYVVPEAILPPALAAALREEAEHPWYRKTASTP